VWCACVSRIRLKVCQDIAVDMHILLGDIAEEGRGRETGRNRERQGESRRDGKRQGESRRVRESQGES